MKPGVAYRWQWMDADQRAEAMASALTHPLPSIRARALRCQADDVEGARECVWIRHDDASWVCVGGIYHADLAAGVRVATVAERAP